MMPTAMIIAESALTHARAFGSIHGGRCVT